MTDMLQVIKKRRSYRSFSNTPVEKKQLETIVNSALCSPSAMHQREWEFFVVTNKAILEELSKTKPGAEFVAQAPAAIVITSNDWKHWLEDASIAAAHIYLETTNQELGTCWVNLRGSQADNKAEQAAKDALGLDEEKRVLCIMPIGHPAETKEAHQPEDYEHNKVTWIE